MTLTEQVQEAPEVGIPITYDNDQI